MNCRITKMPPQKFLVMPRSFKGISDVSSNPEIVKFWDECETSGVIDELLMLRPNGKRNLFGVCTPDKEKTFQYGIGVPIDNHTADFDIPKLEKQGYRIWEVPAGMYVQFNCIGNTNACISATWSHFWQEFLPQTKYIKRDAPDYELYPESPNDDLFCELWIPIATV